MTTLPSQESEEVMLGSRFSVLGSLTVTATLFAGCYHDTYAAPGADTDCGNNSCDVDESLYSCRCDNGDIGPVKCQTGENGADAACKSWCKANSGASQDGDATEVPCQYNPDEGGCAGWSPASHISLNAGRRYLDDVWILGVYQDPAPLWTCENVTLTAVNGGNFQVGNANSGELLYELGLRNGDIPLTINGMSLASFSSVQAALSSTLLSGVTTYTLKVKRGTNTITLLYTLT